LAKILRKAKGKVVADGLFIPGDLDLRGIHDVEIPSVCAIGGQLNVTGCKSLSFTSLRAIGRALLLEESQGVTFPALETVGGAIRTLGCKFSIETYRKMVDINEITMAQYQAEREMLNDEGRSIDALVRLSEKGWTFELVNRAREINARWWLVNALLFACVQFDSETWLFRRALEKADSRACSKFFGQ
jgi:hypothetical protein